MFVSLTPEMPGDDPDFLNDYNVLIPFTSIKYITVAGIDLATRVVFTDGTTLDVRQSLETVEDHLYVYNSLVRIPPEGV